MRQLFFLALFAVVGCADASGPTNRLARTIPQYQLTAALEGRFERGTEDDILRVENFLPGLGGIYVDKGSLVVYVPPEMSRQDALGKLALGSTLLNLDPAMRQQMTSGQKIILRPAKFPFSQLVAWVEGGVGGVLSIPGVTGIDANETTNRVTIFVLDESAGFAALATARAAGLPKDAIETRVVRRAALTYGLRGTFYWPAGGVQIQNEGDHYCSIGFNDTYQNVKGFWTAGHCSKYGNTGNQSLDEHFYQPTYSGGSVGTAIMRSEITLSDTACGSAIFCGQVDAMYVQYDNPLRWESKVAQLEGLTSLAPDTTPVIGDISAYWTNVNLGVSPTTWWAGMPVDKVGRSTGWTRGKLKNTCVPKTFNVGITLSVHYFCNDVIGVDSVSPSVVNIPYVGSGDSGGPVFISNNVASSELKAMGIIIGATVPPNAPFYENMNFNCVSADCEVFFHRLTRIKMFVHSPIY